MFKRVALTVFLALLLLFCGCSGSEPGVLSPSRIDSSMIDRVVKVKGEITMAVENPGGLGGMYLKLGDDEGEVDVRIQDDVWQTFDDKRKAEFREGRTVTAEGVLFQAGRELVVIFGKYSTSSNTTSAGSE